MQQDCQPNIQNISFVIFKTNLNLRFISTPFSLLQNNHILD